jgi:hypothetical protein
MMTPVPKCLTEKKTHCGIRRRLTRAAKIGNRAPGGQHTSSGRITERGGEEQGKEGGNVDGQVNLAVAVCDIASTAMAEHPRRHQRSASNVVRRER